MVRFGLKAILKSIPVGLMSTRLEATSARGRISQREEYILRGDALEAVSKFNKTDYDT